MSKNSTYVSSESKSLFNNIVASNTQLHDVITEYTNESNLFLCKIIRFYPYTDKAYVELLSDGSKIMCRLTHDVLDSEISIRSMNRGTVKTGKKTNATYIEPHDDIYGIVAKVRWYGTKDENCFISCVNLHENSSLKNVVGNGEIILTVGKSSISIKNERINIMTPYLFINGLPSTAPNLENYYDDSEMDLTINTLIEENKLLNETIEKLSERIDDLVEMNNLNEVDN